MAANRFRETTCPFADGCLNRAALESVLNLEEYRAFQRPGNSGVVACDLTSRGHHARLRRSTTHPHCRRSIGPARRPPPAPEGRRYGHGGRHVARGDADRRRQPAVRSAADGSQLHERHDVGTRRDRSRRARAGSRSPALPIIAHDRVGAPSILPSRRCGAGCGTSCRSPGTTAISCASCGQKSRTDACGKRAEAEEKRELAEARRIQRKLLPAVMPSVDGWEIAASWQPATGVGGDCYDAIPFGRGRLGPVDCRRGRQGKIPAALLMSRPAGRGPRVRNRRCAAVGALSARSIEDPVPGRICRRSFHQLLLLRRRLRIGPADVRECRALRARAGPFRRQRRAAHLRRCGARSLS